MTEETRTLNTSISLLSEEWENLERYAANEGKTLQEYIDWYCKYGILTALREGKIFEDFINEK